MSDKSKDFLSDILGRKVREVARRHRHAGRLEEILEPVGFDQEAGKRATEALRRTGGGLRVIAEIKFRSPSAGPIRPRRVGEVQRVAESYAAAGASAVSVLADGPGFGGSVLDVRRASSRNVVPVLFKEFVIDELQVRFARAAGASLVLLLVRALPKERLLRLVDAVRRAGLAPVVEAADGDELRTALASGAEIIGINARDLRTFRVDADGAESLVGSIPRDRIAVYMSGVTSREDIQRISAGRADAALVGEALMRAANPGDKLRELLS